MSNLPESGSIKQQMAVDRTRLCSRFMLLLFIAAGAAGGCMPYTLFRGELKAQQRYKNAKQFAFDRLTRFEHLSELLGNIDVTRYQLDGLIKEVKANIRSVCRGDQVINTSIKDDGHAKRITFTTGCDPFPNWWENFVIVVLIKHDCCQLLSAREYWCNDEELESQLAKWNFDKPKMVELSVYSHDPEQKRKFEPINLESMKPKIKWRAHVGEKELDPPTWYPPRDPPPNE